MLKDTPYTLSIPLGRHPLPNHLPCQLEDQIDHPFYSPVPLPLFITISQPQLRLILPAGPEATLATRAPASNSGRDFLLYQRQANKTPAPNSGRDPLHDKRPCWIPEVQPPTPMETICSTTGHTSQKTERKQKTKKNTHSAKKTQKLEHRPMMTTNLDA